MSYFDDNEARLTGIPRNLPRDDSWLLNPKLLAGTSQGIRNLLGIQKQMQIQIINVAVSQQMSAKGKPYEMAEVTFKNLTYGGKTESKKLMPFGANEAAFKTLKGAQNGQTYEVTVVKNPAGFNDWTAVVAGGGTPSPASFAPAASSPAPASRPNTYETPEERAKKQVYIVRQSSISSAIAALSVGAKSAVPADKVIEVAQQFEAYVFGVDAPSSDASGFDDMHDDIPM